MSERVTLGLFDATGIELEYMIVDQRTLAVRPIADELIKAQCGSYESEIDVGEQAWSNELALHVIEIKTLDPPRRLTGLATTLHTHVRRINQLLAPMGATLMPSGMHPWMDPHTELKLWPHDYSPVYQAFNRIFDCRGHGWANLQACHLNLPFSNDEEFGRLHAAIRVLLPILPALAASSPIADGKPSGLMDTRLEAYRHNSRRVPSVAGKIVPEPVFTQADYEGLLLQRIYDDLAPLDPDGTLRFEWVNARGCIARFDRSAIEIRLLDMQESTSADVAVAFAIVSALRALVREDLSTYEHQRQAPQSSLARVLLDAVRDGEETRVDDATYRALLGYTGAGACTAGELWEHLIEQTATAEAGYPEWRDALDVILEQGCLARRILRRLGGDYRREHLAEVYGELSHCLAYGEVFRAPR